MFGLSAAHLLILFIVLVVFFGAKRLPELGESLGKGIRSFKKSLEGKEEEQPRPKEIAQENSEDNSSNSDSNKNQS